MLRPQAKLGLPLGSGNMGSLLPEYPERNESISNYLRKASGSFELVGAEKKAAVDRN